MATNNEDENDNNIQTTTSILVDDLPDDITKEELNTVFSKYGIIANIWVASNSGGFSFIDFDEYADAEAACKNLDNTVLWSATIRVKIFPPVNINVEQPLT